MSAPFLFDAWYQAAWSNELEPGSMLARKLFDMALLMLRDGDGNVAIVADRCPHRFVPLSRGSYDGERLTCAYHGLTFGGGGRCIANPHGPITDGAHLPSYPAIERYGRVWFWPGEADRADPALIPDLAAFDHLPASALAQDSMQVQCSWLLIVDNLLDLTHSDYVHPAFGDFVTGSEMSVAEREGGLTVRWNAADQETPGIFRTMVPTQRCDVWLQSDWLAPSTIVVGTGASPPGGDSGGTLWSIHAITPETATSSHYFFGFARDFNLADEAFTAMMKQAGTDAFVNEDKPILESQQDRIGEADLFELKPLVLPGDRGAVITRRRLASMIRAQG